jgi:23S rRNA (pseudouridine1915-N3)-methyltransferase
MALLIVAVGRARKGPMRELFDDYAGRLKPGIKLREVEERRPLKGDVLKAKEAALLLAGVPKGAYLVALDSSGKAPASEELAQRLQGWRDDGGGTVAFVIGGADGLDDAVLARADLKLSLGPMTWPHMLVRVMLAEQLYRADCILRNHPYHKGR